MTTQTPLCRMSMTTLHEQLAEVKPELKEDSDGDLYISIPTEGYYAALEIEAYETPRTLFFTLHRRGWDRTGGMTMDVELAETHELYLMLALVKAELAYKAVVDQTHEQYERNYISS